MQSSERVLYGMYEEHTDPMTMYDTTTMTLHTGSVTSSVNNGPRMLHLGCFMLYPKQDLSLNESSPRAQRL